MATEIQSEAILSQLSRIVSSTVFRQSDRMCRFLRYVVEEALAGRGGDIKEYSIGIAVCDRKESYDPRVDSVVRVEAIRLRSRLREYYTTCGADDPLIIDMPKGAYIPVFSERIVKPAADAPALSGRHSARWKAWLIPAGAAVVVAALVMIYPASRLAKQNAQRPNRIAVLPFDSLGSGEDTDAYSQGFADSVMTDLAKVRGIEVIARNSVSGFKGKKVRARDLGQRLAADFLLEGELQKTDAGYHVTARLIRASDEGSVWAADYESSWSNLLALEKRLSEAVARELNDRLSAADVAAIGRAMTTRPEIYDAVLKGRHNSLQYFYSGNEKYYIAAEGLLTNAVSADPSYANAAVELGLLYGRRYQLSGETDMERESSPAVPTCPGHRRM